MGLYVLSSFISISFLFIFTLSTLPLDNYHLCFCFRAFLISHHTQFIQWGEKKYKWNVCMTWWRIGLDLFGFDCGCCHVVLPTLFCALQFLFQFIIFFFSSFVLPSLFPVFYEFTEVERKTLSNVHCLCVWNEMLVSYFVFNILVYSLFAVFAIA